MKLFRCRKEYEHYGDDKMNVLTNTSIEKGFDNVKMVVTLNPIPEDASVPVQLNQRYKLELEDIERKYTQTQTFQTVQEYNDFCTTPQVFAIH